MAKKTIKFKGIEFEEVKFTGTGFSILQACRVSGISFKFPSRFNDYQFSFKEIINDDKYSDKQRKMFWRELEKIGTIKKCGQVVRG